MSPLLTRTSKTESFTYKEAFSRNAGLLSENEQQKLRHAHVAIAGLGGVGGVQAEALARMGVGCFSLADFDHFEIKNFNRQRGATLSSLGRAKIDVIQDMILEINPEAEVRLFDQGIVEQTIDDFLEGVDVVIDSLDVYAFDARFLLYRKAREKKIWVISTAPPGFGVTLLVFDPKGMSFEDYFDIHPDMSREKLVFSFLFGINPSLLALQYIDRQQLRQHGAPLPCIAPAFYLAAGITATETFKILLQKRPVKPVPWVLQFDARLHVFKRKYYRWGMHHVWQRLRRRILFGLIQRKGDSFA